MDMKVDKISIDVSLSSMGVLNVIDDILFFSLAT